MMDALQASYFANTPYLERRAWILQDPLVRTREERVLRDLSQAVAALSVGARVVELGCGEGINLELLAAMPANAGRIFIGYDPCREAVLAGQRAGVDTREGDGIDVPLPEPSGSADLVFCRDVLHHLPNIEARERFIGEMKRLAKPGATIMIIEPSVTHPLIFLQQLVQPAERGVKAIREEMVMRLLPPHAKVSRYEPSLVWRLVCHYRMPLFAHDFVHSPWGERALNEWETLTGRIVPSRWWGYRVYSWISE